MVVEDALAADVRGHDQDRVLEVNRASLTVGQAAVVENLQEHVEDLGRGFLDLVEQNDGKGTAPNRFGELPALFVPDVARRRPEQARDRMFFAVLRHVDAHHRPVVVEKIGRQRAREFGLADARGAQKDERTDRAVWIGETRTRSNDRFGNPRYGFVLTDDALVQLFVEPQQFLHFAFEEFRNGDAGPAAYDRGNIFLVDLFLEQARLAVAASQGRFFLLELFFKAGEFAVPQLGGAVEVVLTLGLFDLGLGGLDLPAQLAEFSDGGFLCLPARFDAVALGAQIREFLFDPCEAPLRTLVGFLFQRFTFDFELHHAARCFVQFDRHRIDLGAEFGGRLVDQIDRLVG